MRPFRLAIWIGLAAGIAEGFEISGRIHAEEDGRPLAGVRVRLLARGDSTVTDSAGVFRLNLDGAGLRPKERSPAGALQARLRAGMLEYRAAGGQSARIDLYGTDGKIRGSLVHHPASPGIQRVALSPLAAGTRGLGWIRLGAEGLVEWIRILNLGSGNEPSASALPGGPVASASPHPAALAKPAFAYIDSLRAEKAGYYPLTRWIEDSTTSAGLGDLDLWKNPSEGLDPAEAEAWRAFLRKPTMTIRVGGHGISWPDSLAERQVELADGTLADTWSDGECLPGPRPKTLRVAYARQGRAYRDTIRLEPLWKLLDSFRTVGVDTSGPRRPRFHLAWDWPTGFSALPERDWIDLTLIRGFSEDDAISFPDVFNLGIGHGIEGGVRRYGAFDPARGDWTLEGYAGARPRITAAFTLARRDDHDLRIVVQSWPRTDPIRFSFLNAWPEGGLLPAGQVLRLQAESEPAAAFSETGSAFPKLQLLPEGAGYAVFLKSPWDGSPLDWSFPFPVRDTVAFRLKAWTSDTLQLSQVCQIPALSPILRAIPSPADTAANAFEPNETPEQAATVPFGQWIEAAWDYRINAVPDADHYRFQAPAGSRFRFRLRNPNDARILLDQSFADGDQGFGPEAGQEMERVYAMRDSGDHLFDIRPVYFSAGRYSFRIDPEP